MSTKRKNPFTPGYGRFPPYLAGRETEQNLISEQVEALADGDYNVTDITIVGPRGAGKTVALQWAALEAGKKKRSLFSKKRTPQVVRILPDVLKRKEDIPKLFLSPKDFDIDTIETGPSGLRAKWLPIGNSLTGFFPRLVKQSKRRPLILLLDEAHSLAPELCGFMFQIVQAVRQEGGLLLLILAGTPGLYGVMARARATFHERGAKISLGLLEPEAAADAIRIPLAREGISIKEVSLQRIVADSQCYPYFLQAWGKALWTEANKCALTTLDDELVNHAAEEVNAIRRGLYEDRRSQWRGVDQRFLIEIAKAVKIRNSFGPEALENTVRNILLGQDRSEDETSPLVEKLVATDFLWKPWGSTHFIPGIPSLVSYVIESEEGSGEKFEGVREPMLAGGLAW